jgi:hypothetical protein
MGLGFPGTAYDIAVTGNVAYLARPEKGLGIVDVSDPTTPREVGVREAGQDVRGVAVAGPVGYIATYDKLQVLDLRDPLNPQPVGALNLKRSRRITLGGNAAYVAAESSMVIVDVTDRTDPVRRGVLETSGYAWNVAVSDGMAYVADGTDGLQIIDVSDPTRPRERGSFKNRQAGVEGDFGMYDVAVSEHYAYVTYTSVTPSDRVTGSLILDVSDPDRPVALGRLELPWIAQGITLSGSLAYVTCGEAGLQIIDISDRASPRLVGSIDTPGFAMDVAILGDVVYVCHDYGEGGLRIIDVSDPKRPREIRSQPEYEFMQLTISNNKLVAVGSSGLGIFDLAKRFEPRLLALLVSYEAAILPLSVAAVDGMVVMGEWTAIRVYDVTDPSTPVERARYQPPSAARGIVVADRLLYVANQDAGLLILQVSR